MFFTWNLSECASWFHERRGSGAELRRRAVSIGAGGGEGRGTETRIINMNVIAHGLDGEVKFTCLFVAQSWVV